MKLKLIKALTALLCVILCACGAAHTGETDVLSPHLVPAKDGGGPAVLIYHTHISETYDDKTTVSQAAELLADELAALGISVIHDTTDHEPPDIRTAYNRSLVTIEEYAQLYPSLEIFIDLHIAQDEDAEQTDGCAPVFFIVGTGKNTDYDALPAWKNNYGFAKKISGYLEKASIQVLDGRYNQHISAQSLLIELGTKHSSKSEVCECAKKLARAFVNSRY